MYNIKPHLLLFNNAPSGNLQRPMATEEIATIPTPTYSEDAISTSSYFMRSLYQGSKDPPSTNTSLANESTYPGDKRHKDSTYSINDNCRSLADHFHVTFLKETNINYPRTIEFHISKTIEFHTPRTIEHSHTKDCRTFILNNYYATLLLSNCIRPTRKGH